MASVGSGQKPSTALTDTMLRAMCDLSKDSVTDVRICVARFVGSACGMFLPPMQRVYHEADAACVDKFVRESEPVPDLLAEIVQRLSRDNSLSVKRFVPDPAALLGGESVTFPSFKEEVEPQLVTPMRSRHFSKPPLPRRGSSATVSSAADSLNTEDRSIDANVNGAGMVVERSYGGQNNARDDDQRYGATDSQAGMFQPDPSVGSVTPCAGVCQLPPRTIGCSSNAMDVDDGEVST